MGLWIVGIVLEVKPVAMTNWQLLQVQRQAQTYARGQNWKIQKLEVLWRFRVKMSQKLLPKLTKKRPDQLKIRVQAVSSLDQTIPIWTRSIQLPQK